MFIIYLYPFMFPFEFKLTDKQSLPQWLRGLHGLALLRDTFLGNWLTVVSGGPKHLEPLKAGRANSPSQADVVPEEAGRRELLRNTSKLSPEPSHPRVHFKHLKLCSSDQMNGKEAVKF